MPQDNLSKLHKNLSEKWEGFNVPIDQFKSDMQNEENINKLHSSLTEKWEGFNVPLDQFKSDMGLTTHDLELTKLSGEEERKFQDFIKNDPSVIEWKNAFIEEFGEDPSIEDAEYDYRGAWKAGIKPEKIKGDKIPHWGSIGIGGRELKSKTHPTRWKSDYMEATGKDPDEEGISKSDAMLVLKKTKQLESDLPELELPESMQLKTDLPEMDLSETPKVEEKGFLSSLWGNVKAGALNTVAGVVEKSKAFAHAPFRAPGGAMVFPQIRDEDTGELRNRTPEENKAVADEFESKAFEIKDKADSIQAELESFDQGIWDNIKSGNVIDAGKQLSYAFANTAPTMAAIAINPYSGITASSIGVAGTKELELRKEIKEGVADYTEAEIQASSWAYGGAEVVGDILLGGMLKQSGNLLKGIMKSGGKEASKQASKELAKTLVKGFTYEGSGEGATQVLQNSIDKYMLEKDVKLTDGLADAIITGVFISGQTVMGSYLMGKALNKFTPPSEQDVVKNNTLKIQSLTKSANDPTISESQKTVIDKAKSSLIEENNQIMSKAKKTIDDMSIENRQTVLDKTDEINKIDEVLKDPFIDEGTKTALIDNKNKLQKDINEILEPEEVVEPEKQVKPKEDAKEVREEVEEAVSKEKPVEEEVREAGIRDVKEDGLEAKEPTKEVIEPEVEGVVIPAETLSKANKSFTAAQENLTDADAATESFKAIERSEWYEALPEDQKKLAKEKYFNEITERFIPIPEKRVKSKVQTEIDKFVSPKRTKKVTVNEYSALKDQIRLEARAAKEGVKEAKTDIGKSQSSLLDYIKTSLYAAEGKDIGKSDLNRLLSGVKSAVSFQQLAKQIDKVDSVVANVQERSVKRKKKDIAKFVGKTRTTQISGKVKARGGDVFTIPYFQKASGVIKSIKDISKQVKSELSKKYSTEGLTGKKLKDKVDERNAAQSQLENERVNKAMDDAYQEALDKLVNGPEHTANKYNAELQAIEDFRNFNALDIDTVDEFSSRLKDIDKAGRENLKSEIAKESNRLRDLVHDIESSIEPKDEKTENRRDKENKTLLQNVWERIKESPSDLFNFITRPTNHVKTMLELMSTEAVEVGKGTVIKKIYDPIVKAESSEIKGIAESHKKVKDIAEKTLGLKSDKEFANLDKRMSEFIEIRTEKDGVEGVDVVTKGEAMSIYAWSRTPELARELSEKNGISATEIENMKDQIGSDLVQFVDEVGNWLSTEYADRVNDVYRRIFRIDFSGRQDYHPVVRAKSGTVDISTDSDPFTKLSSTMASALKERTSTDRKLMTKSAVDGKDVSFVGLISNHITEMEHFMAWADVAKSTSAILSSDKFKTRANQKLGKKGFDLVSKLLRHSINKDIFKAEYGVGSTIVSAYGIGVLGAKIKQLPVQLTSIVTGAVEYQNANASKFPGYNSVMWAKDVASLATNPMKAGRVFAEILLNNPKIRARVDKGSNLDPDFIKRESKRAAKLGIQRGFYERVQRFVMAPTLAGDVGAIMYGYAPIYMQAKAKYMNEGMSEADAIKKASEEFDIYEESQQTRSAVHLSQAQLNASFGNRLVTTFKSSNILFLNQTIQSVNSISRSIKAGKKPNKKDIKRLIMYHSVVNMAYQLVASGVTAFIRGDDEDAWSDLGRAAIMGNLNALFVVGDVINFIADQVQGKTFGLSLGVGVYDQVERAIKGFFKEKDHMDEYVELMYFLGSLFRMPLKNIENTVEGATELIETGDLDDFLKTLGYSEYGITGKTRKVREKEKKKHRGLKSGI